MMSDPTSDEEVLRQVVSRLAVRFPELSQERLRETAVRSLHDFDGARVRDFVPLLAERGAVMALQSTAVG